MNITRLRRELKRTVILGGIIILTLALVLSIEYSIMNGNNRKQAFRTEMVLTDQVGNILESNLKKKEILTDELKENYISKAKATAYILEKNPELENDFGELDRIAGLMSIDEIHIFDDSGTIVAGSVPKYFGYSFDSGEQMAYFKAMLDDRTLSMCQDVTPNTAEGKAMMYAICWNDSGTQMIQVGIEPLRLLEELRSSRISEVINGLPAYEGMEIIVADCTTDEVVGATISHHLGKTMQEIGIDRSQFHLPMIENRQVTVGHAASYCYLKEQGDYVIAAVQKKDVVNRDIPVILITLAAYLILAVALITVIVRQMLFMLHDEKRNANTDSLTGLLNRRAYENDMKKLANKILGKDFLYLELDLNGLKEVNDTHGHEAGDEMIRSMADCMNQSFGKYGSVYRTGGDEFVGLLFLAEEQFLKVENEMKQLLSEWTRSHEWVLSASWGSAGTQRDSGLTLQELARLADERMYKVKAEYYTARGKDRRH